jgi:hypothetical protein
MLNTIVVECVTNVLWIWDWAFNVVDNELFNDTRKEKHIIWTLVHFDVDEVSTFQSLRSRMANQTQCYYVPFVTIVHNMIHQTNLTVQTFKIIIIIIIIIFIFASKFFCNVYMDTSSIILIGFWSLPNWQRSWKLNATKFCATSNLNGHLWLVLLNACCLNITLSSWKWHWMHPQFIMMDLIYLWLLTWNHCWGWMQWCHY